MIFDPLVVASRVLLFVLSYFFARPFWWFATVLRHISSWRILIYSGDADSAVPFIGTQRWIQCLNSPITSDWANWNYEGAYCDAISFP